MDGNSPAGTTAEAGARLSLRGHGSTFLAAAVVFAAYIGAAKLGLSLAVAHGVISPVWPPTGIAIAALLLFGPRLWPAIALGAFVSNATSGVSLGVAAGIGVGNTLEALAAVYLLRRVGFRLSFDRVRDVLSFAVFGALLSAAVAATNGVTILALTDSEAASPYGSRWVLWWLGDATGALLVAPFLLVLATRSPRLPRGRSSIEAAVLLAGLVGMSAAIFLGGLWRYPYLLVPLLIWASLRFTQLGAAAASLIVAAVAVAGVVSEATPLAGHDETVAVQILQALLAVVAISLLALGASLSERDAALSSLQSAAARLAEAQELAHVGSWEWDIASGRVTWSSELYRIWGLSPESGELNYDAYLSGIHPGDRDSIRHTIEEALAERRSFETKHRILLGDGKERVIQGRGRVILGPSGAPVRMVGTAQDVTERQRLEEVRDNILSSVSHELRTPLTSILGFAQTLRERGSGLSDETRKTMIHHLADEAVRLERLLTDLLDADRLRHGRLRATFERTDVGALVAGVVTAHPTEGRPVEINAESISAEVDLAKVERIVHNLLSNALRHTPAGSPIGVFVERSGDSVLLRIDDRGPGVPQDEREAIFGLFTRGAGDESAAPGAGVGLSLVAQFAALHGGRAWVEDNPGGGASFRVLLPATSTPTV